MVVLQGELGQSLKVFPGFSHIPCTQGCALVFFQTACKSWHWRAHFLRVFDNAFDGGLQGDGNALIELTRQAFERGRQLIIVTRAEEGDREIDNLSGPRAIAPQPGGKRAEDFLWSGTPRPSTLE